MKRQLLLTGVALAAVAGQARAQGDVCAGAEVPTAAEDVCQKAADLFSYLAPQLGTVVAGGNATLGQGGTLGGPGRFALSLRATALEGSLPRVDDVTPSINGRRRDTYETEEQYLGLPALDAAVGIFKGVPLGVTTVGGVDLLVNVAYLPEYSGEDVDLRVPDGAVKFGFGARVGLVEETYAVPGVAVSVLRRDLPTVDVTAEFPDGNLVVRSLSAETTSWRVTASKSFFVFGLAVGAGQDRYDASAVVSGEVGGLESPGVELGQEVTRTNYFADLSFNIAPFRFVAEIGQVSGGDVETFNRFDDTAADASRLYAAAGLRLGF